MALSVLLLRVKLGSNILLLRVKSAWVELAYVRVQLQSFGMYCQGTVNLLFQKAKILQNNQPGLVILYIMSDYECYFVHMVNFTKMISNEKVKDR